MSSLKELQDKIKELSWSGPGAEYEGKVKGGKRNPIRDDTQALLSMFAYLKRPSRMLEIGTAFGLSGLCLQRGIGDAHLTTIEFDAETVHAARKNFEQAGVGDRTTVLNGDASDKIHDLEGQFDLVFIDHEKSLYLPNFQLLKEKGLLAEGCLVLADNVIDRQEECAEFVQYMTDNFFPTTVVQTECGLLVAIV